jgi:hypothetical protein
LEGKPAAAATAAETSPAAPHYAGSAQAGQAAPSPAPIPEAPSLATGAPLDLAQGPGDPGAPAAETALAPSGVVAPGTTDQAAAVVEPTQATPQPSTAAPSAAAQPTAAPLTTADVFPDFAKASNSSQLKAIRKRLGSAAASRLPVSTPAKLGTLLPRSIAKLDAMPVIIGPTMAGDRPVSVVARLYRKDDREIYIKVTDTVQAPFMRDPVLNALEKAGGVGEGFGHGRIIAGHPAVLRYYAQGRSSQLTALVNERFLIDVRMMGTADPYAALKTFKALSLGSLK